MDSVLFFTATLFMFILVSNGYEVVALLLAGFLAFSLKKIGWIITTLGAVGLLIFFRGVLGTFYFPAAFAVVLALTLAFHYKEGQQEQYPPGYGPEYEGH